MTWETQRKGEEEGLQRQQVGSGRGLGCKGSTLQHAVCASHIGFSFLTAAQFSAPGFTPLIQPLVSVGHLEQRFQSQSEGYTSAARTHTKELSHSLPKLPANALPFPPLNKLLPTLRSCTSSAPGATPATSNLLKEPQHSLQQLPADAPGPSRYELCMHLPDID